MRPMDAIQRTLSKVSLKRPGPRSLPGSQGSDVTVDVRGLEAELRRSVEGEVRFDDGSRALYATDASNYRQVPIGVVIPRSIADVLQTVRVCRRYGAPLLSRGGGTSLAGQCCNVAVVIDWMKYLDKVLEIDAGTKTARVQPGTVLDTLRNEAEKYHLTFGPDPATHDHCTLGGMLGNNSCGSHAQMAGPVSHNVLELDVLTYDGLRLKVGPTSEAELQALIRAGGHRGDIYRKLRDLRDRYADEIRRRYPRIPRRISGYNLDSLLPEHGFNVARALVGSEGTCVTILEAKLRLVHSPPHRVVVLFGYPDVYEAADHAAEFSERFKPLALEGLDQKLIHYVLLKGDITRMESLHPKSSHAEFVRLLPEGKGYLMLELGADTKEEAVEKAREVMDTVKRERLASTMKLYSEMKDIEHVWKVRESGLGATARVPGQPDNWPGWEDSAVPPEKLGDYLRGVRKLYDKYGYDASLYGHFGQGCLHTRINFDLVSSKGLRDFRSFMSDAVDLCVSMGGSLSGEHGDGQARAEFLPRMFGPELVRAFREFKSIWDPLGKMNPGKVVDPNPIDQELRLGRDYKARTWKPRTHFQYPDDDGRLHRATERCVGVGKCRRESGDTMCPSYRVTKEEKHTTRGRAHLLFEMLQGEVVKKGWRDENVKESLDLCLACKGCKGDCPVEVDLATLKAEFLSHYYQGRLRPRPAYAMGLIMFWARAAMFAPGAVNFLTQHSPSKEWLQKLGGMTTERKMPRFAPESFQHWVARRPVSRGKGRRRVMLWPDTFNNHFFPETAASALEVLEDAGFEVVVPQGFLCCGRPLYDFGMLPTAKWLLRRTLKSLRKEIEDGVPLVGLEPSCVSVFRDELRNLFPDAGLAEQLRRQTFLFSEFLDKYAQGAHLPRLEKKAVVHGHCHHKSLFQLIDETSLLDKLGLDYEAPETGCCGMAGSFGFEAGEKYEISQKVGERVLLPKVRETPKDTLLIADGFSCREQIAQNTDRQALHVAQVVRMAKAYGASGPSGEYPERGWVTNGLGRPPPRWGLRMAVVGVGLLLGGLRLLSRARE
ncbi:FAD-binding and (Fe-S)-binding domain-containing protein [Vitiosangium sp. GDMCC 1.1324]|uniref:FAD-binding and (Fe-S)-binding domain-containing protein n=1 Tax=Vitiosangium sp. (strain GDMCC 1.1324) TaxID=2138576 RepID=UPI000D36102A|nr:FAD-binding and (Fe-S)-binding domain-containing protein [Vitiosangium sp. GDMCC 1.1324]PTL76027.1 FAD-binding oxidoreductase [Vitiosangium sp. GDMCC 1.1324]